MCGPAAWAPRHNKTITLLGCGCALGRGSSSVSRATTTLALPRCLPRAGPAGRSPLLLQGALQLRCLEHLLLGALGGALGTGIGDKRRRGVTNWPGAPGDRTRSRGQGVVQDALLWGLQPLGANGCRRRYRPDVGEAAEDLYRFGWLVLR